MSRTPINTSDPDAIERLEAKIKAHQDLQDLMKASNRIIRNKKMNDENKIIALMKLGHKEDAANELLHPTTRWDSVGYPSYRLTNNNATLKTAKARLESVKQMQSKESREEEIHGVTVEWDAEDGRVRLHFPTPGGRVSNHMYKVCRSNGFVFARSIDAFSRKWTNSSAEYKVQWVLDAYKAELDEALAQVPEAA